MLVDIYCCPVPTDSNPADVRLRLTTEGCNPKIRGALFVADKDAPIVAQSLYDDLAERYGPAEGRKVYFAMEREAKGPFGPGMKYDVANRPAQPVRVIGPK